MASKSPDWNLGLEQSYLNDGTEAIGVDSVKSSIANYFEVDALDEAMDCQVHNWLQECQIGDDDQVDKA